jgi:ADP-ribose pyrophosphatase YjhB (NUDIX family)
MQEMVVCFPIKGNNIFLGKRKKEPWKGKFSGFGGRVGYAENYIDAQIRELQEEAEIIVQPENLIRQGTINIDLNGKEKLLHIFIIKKWQGCFKETEEMEPQKFSLNEIPYELMAKGDEYWLPIILNGKYFKAEMKRGEDLNEFEYLNFLFVGYIN